LIEDKAERKRLAANAKDWVSEHRDAMKEVPRWVRIWEELREATAHDTPHMPESEWAGFMEEMEAQERAASAEPEPVPA
jgi:hypothetical protein